MSNIVQKNRVCLERVVTAAIFKQEGESRVIQFVMLYAFYSPSVYFINSYFLHFSEHYPLTAACVHALSFNLFSVKSSQQ